MRHHHRNHWMYPFPSGHWLLARVVVRALLLASLLFGALIAWLSVTLAALVHRL